MLKTALILIVAALCSTAAIADTYVRGYTRSDGTYVAPHHRSSPDGNFNNNWSTQGNVNPYTGQPGHLPPQGNNIYTQPAPQYPAPVYQPRRF